MTPHEQDKIMNSAEHNFDAALEYAKGMAEYSNLARCYIALAKKATREQKVIVVASQEVEQKEKPEVIVPIEQSKTIDPEQPKRRGRPPKTESNLIDL